MASSKLVCPHCGSKGPHSVHSKARARYECGGCGRTFSRMSALAAVDPEVLDSPGYVVTCAVSDAWVHKPFLRALERYCDETGYRLLIVPVRYHNPTSNTENPSEWFDETIEPYQYRGRGALGEHITLFGDISIQPTAARPLSSLTTLGGVGGNDSSVFGHPKVALESIATSPGKPAKLAMTTGAVTRAAYSDTKAGKKGEFHHVIGAIVVERDGRKFHARHILANKDGSFYDLDKRWDEYGNSEAKAKVLTCGDIHAVRSDPGVLQATFFADDSIVQRLKPQHIVLHDVLDFQSASHHNTLHERYRLSRTGRNKVEAELDETAKLIDRIAGCAPWATIHVVDSNHHRHLTQWLQNPNSMQDVSNLLLFHKLNAAVLEGIDEGKSIDPFEYWCRYALKHSARVHFLARNESLCIDGIEYAEHGDRGPNGSKGSLMSFTKVGAKMVVAHGHGSGIADGVTQVGTTSLMDLGYNPGLSNWTHTHCATYMNSKRALLHIHGERWCA